MSNATTDTLPEPDRLEGFPHPRETRKLFGHERHENELARSFSNARMHHSWLITGPEGIGKATLAYRFAKFALARAEERRGHGKALDIAEESRTLRQVQLLSHPGLLVLRRPFDLKSKRFMTKITIDEVRRLRGFLRHHSDAGSWRVVIVDRADEMNLNAANAILKALEEPPERTIFFLLTIEPGRLLNTIRSRCRLLPLSPLNERDLQLAGEQASEAAEFDTASLQQLDNLVQHAEGSVRRLLYLSTEEGFETYESVVTLLKNAANPNWTDVHQKVDALTSATDSRRFDLFYDMLLGEVARKVRVRATHRTGLQDPTLAQEEMGDRLLASWASVWETLWRRRSEAELLNLDRKALILGAIECLEIATRNHQKDSGPRRG